MVELIKLGLPRGPQLWLGLVSAALQALSAMALLALSGYLISRSAEMPPVMYLLVAVVAVRTFALGRAVFRYGERYFLHSAVLSMLANWRPTMMQKLVPWAPAGYLAVNRQRELIRVVKDVEELQEFTVRVLAPLVQVAVAFLFAIGLAAWFLPEAIISIVGLSLLAVATAFGGTLQAIRRSEISRHKVRNRFRVELAEYLENLESIRLLDWQTQLRQNLQKQESELIKVEQGSSNMMSAAGALFLGFLPLAIVALSMVAAEAVATGRLPGPLLATFALLSLALFDIYLGLQGAAGAWVRYRASAESVLKILQRPVPPALNNHPRGPLASRASVTGWKRLSLNGISLQYPNSPHASIGPIDLEISKGSVTAILGASGSGKSSLGLILTGLMAPVAGEVIAEGGQPKVGLLEQHPVVLAGSVEQNLRIGSPTATVDRLQQALEVFGLAETFAGRGGLSCELGERGLVISGGEAARLAAARLWLADFDIYVLDEPSANLDRQNAQVLVQNFLQLERTLVVISHDSNLIEGLQPIRFQMPAARVAF